MNRLTNVAVTASVWYSYDSAGRLWQKGYDNGDMVTQAQHGYDAHNRRVRRPSGWVGRFSGGCISTMAGTSWWW